MFEDFTFDSPRSPSLGSDGSTLTRETSRSVSPCTEPSAFPRPAFSVTDLAAQFGNQRLRKDSQICYDPCDAYANNDDDAAWALPSLTEEQESNNECGGSSSRSHIPARPHSPTRRLVRQVNTRLLCSGAHQREIAALVSRMVETDQCNIISASTSPTQAPEDEGYDSDNSPNASRRSSVAGIRPGMGYRRASDMNKTGACVSKNVRLRKNTAEHSRKRSSGKQ